MLSDLGIQRILDRGLCPFVQRFKRDIGRNILFREFCLKCRSRCFCRSRVWGRRSHRCRRSSCRRPCRCCSRGRRARSRRCRDRCSCSRNHGFGNRSRCFSRRSCRSCCRRYCRERRGCCFSCRGRRNSRGCIRSSFRCHSRRSHSRRSFCRDLRHFRRLPALFLSDTELLLRLFTVIDQILLIRGKSSAGPVGLQLCCLLYIFTGPKEQHDPVTHGDALRRLPCLQVLFRQLIHPLFVDLRRGITLQRDDLLLRGRPLRAQDLILKQILPGIVVGQIFKLRAEGIRLLHISGPNREFRQPEHDMPRVRCALHRQKKDLLRLLQFPVLLINVGDQGKKVHVRDPSPVDAVGDLHCRLVIMKIILFPHLVDFQIELVFIHCHWSCLFRFCCHSSK